MALLAKPCGSRPHCYFFPDIEERDTLAREPSSGRTSLQRKIGQNGQPARGRPMGWAAHTHHWTLGTGISVWLVGDDNSLAPPAGAELPIILGDAAVVASMVIETSASEIIIELYGTPRRMTRAAPQNSTGTFPGAEWILGERVSR